MEEHNNLERSPFGGDFSRMLKDFSPLVMFVRLYSKAIMIWDFTHFLVFAFCSIFKAILYTFKPPSRKSLNNEIALVVGASRGVGREISLQIADLGATVICLDINSVDNESTVKQIIVNKRTAHAYTCDITQSEQVKKTINAIENDVGNITMLFHCSSLPSPRSLINEPPLIHATIDVSVISHFWLLENILPKMKQLNRGHIVLLTSVAGVSGIKHHMPLSVSQFAIQGLFESIIEELRISKFYKTINVTIAHIYPFIIQDSLKKDIRLRIPSYFGIINAKYAAREILNGVRRNYMEISIPGYLLYMGHLLRLLPKRATFLLRDMLDTGVDFG